MLKVLQVRIQEQESCRFKNSKYVSLDQSRKQFSWLNCVSAEFYSIVIHIVYMSLFPNVHWCAFLSISGKTGTFNQDLLPFLATFELEVLDWDLWCIWAFYCNKVVLVFEHFILYVSFVTDCQRGRLLGSKSLEQLANREHKLV